MGVANANHPVIQCNCAMCKQLPLLAHVSVCGHTKEKIDHQKIYDDTTVPFSFQCYVRVGMVAVVLNLVCTPQLL